MLKVFFCNMYRPHPTTTHTQPQLFLFLYFLSPFSQLGASLIAQLVKNPPAMQETWVWSLGWEVSLKKGMAAHSSILILAWRTPWREEPGGYSLRGHRESDMTEWLAQVHKSEWPPSKNKCLENMWRRDPVAGNITWYSHYGGQMETP